MQFSKYHHFQFHLVTIAVEMFLTQKTSSYLCNLPLEKKKFCNVRKIETFDVIKKLIFL